MRITFISVFCLFGPFLCNSSPNVDQDRIVFDHTKDGLYFAGNQNETDYFKLLQLDGTFLLIGARDNVYNISMNDFSVTKSISWLASEKAVQDCLMNGKSREACRNYIRVLAKDGPGEVLVCGTNAYRPTCRQYQLNLFGEYVMIREFAGNGITPYDPDHNSTFVKDGHFIYAGTVSDLSGTDPLIYRHDLDLPEELGIRTERSDKKCLNHPAFVGSIQDNDFVYFWFREDAVQYTSCGKHMYSRVGRLCKKDQGGPGAHGDSWTSFLKSRLNCSLPGDYPFYFDEIEAISELVQGRYFETQTTANVIYAVFNTPYAAIRGSALCAFNLEEIRRVLADSPFKTYQSPPNADWQSDQPNRHGNCQKDSKSLSEEQIAFAKNHPLVEQSVPNFFQSPILIHTGLIDRFTQIAVDPQVMAADGQKYDVLFIGTDRGRVLKVVNTASSDHVIQNGALAIEIETFKVLKIEGPIRNLLLYGKDRNEHSNKYKNDKKNGYLVAVSDHEVRRLPLHFCERSQSCQDCVKMRDPYCAWDINRSQCVSRSDFGWTGGEYVQNIAKGKSGRCPIEVILSGNDEENVVRAIPEKKPSIVAFDRAIDPPIAQSKTTNNNNCSCEPQMRKEASHKEVFLSDRFRDQSEENSQIRESDASTKIISAPATTTVAAQSMVLAVIIAILSSLLVGFICGYICSHKQCLRKKKDTSRTPSFKQNFTPKSNEKTSNMINAYEHTPKFNGHPPPPTDCPVSLVMSLDDNEPARLPPDKMVHNDFQCGTLPKDYKVKKMYL